MELYLIRHGQSVNNALPQELRVHDPPLTDIGRQQAERLAHWLRDIGLTRLITSPFLRTLETTNLIYRSTGLRPDVWIDLHEQGGCVSGSTVDVMVGEPGMTREEIEREFPRFRLIDKVDGSGWWNSRPYEPVDLAIQRAHSVIERTRGQYGDTSDRVAFVMHGIFKRIFAACLLCESNPNATELGTVHNTSVSKFVVTRETSQLEYFNRIDHLDGDLVTA